MKKINMETLVANEPDAAEMEERDLHDGHIPVDLRVEIGQTTLRRDEVRNLRINSVIKLDTRAGEHVKIYAGDVLLLK
jgi:flagellar motor switch/type III secretory pathway protein FliN